MNSEFALNPGFDLFSAPWKLMARMQCEGLALISRRAQALATVPTTLANCHGPDDYMTQSVMFWQIAQRQYTESLGRVMAAVPGAVSNAATAPQAATEKPVQRDYMVVSSTSQPHVAAPKTPVPTTVDEDLPPVRVRRSA